MAATTLDSGNKDSSITLSNGDMSATQADAGSWGQVASTVGWAAGKWYWEWVTTTHVGVNNTMVGCGPVDAAVTSFPGGEAASYGYFESNGQKYNSGSGSAYGDTYTTEVIGVALDMDNGKVWFSKSDVWQASGNPGAGTNEAFSGLSGTVYAWVGLNQTNAAGTINFGATPFSGTVPSGFLGPDAVSRRPGRHSFTTRGGMRYRRR